MRLPFIVALIISIVIFLLILKFAKSVKETEASEGDSMSVHKGLSDESKINYKRVMFLFGTECPIGLS